LHYGDKGGLVARILMNTVAPSYLGNGKDYCRSRRPGKTGG
jgi:hypothetical protein